MYKVIMLLIVALLLSGCAKYHDSLVNPATKNGVNCIAEGWGWLGTPLAARSSNICLRQYKAAGYIPLEEYVKNGGKVEELDMATVEFTSNINPSTIYSGPADGQGPWVRLAKTTPWILMVNAKTVIPECYKASHGGKESNVICFDKHEHVRKVRFTY